MSHLKIQLVVLLFIGKLGSCTKDKVLYGTGAVGLQAYIEANSTLQLDGLIACAGGTSSSFLGDTINPISVFLYSALGASEFRYYETDSVNVDPNDFNNYTKKNYSLTDLFDGIMKKFERPALTHEKWVVVTFKTPGKLHVCNPIRLKASLSPTIDISSITTVTDNGITPHFDWSAESEPNNVIYFSIVSSTVDALISGTYTYDKFWTFYDTSNVVLNVTPIANPSLDPATMYNYTLMGVSVDNWVHTIATKSFTTQ